MATDNLRREINFEKFKKHYPNEFLEMQTELLFVLYTNPLILKNKNTYIFGENVKSKRHEKERWWDIVKQWLVRRSSHITEYKGGCFAMMMMIRRRVSTTSSLSATAFGSFMKWSFKSSHFHGESLDSSVSPLLIPGVHVFHCPVRVFIWFVPRPINTTASDSFFVL